MVWAISAAFQLGMMFGAIMIGIAILLIYKNQKYNEKENLEQENQEQETKNKSIENKVD